MIRVQKKTVRILQRDLDDFDFNKHPEWVNKIKWEFRWVIVRSLERYLNEYDFHVWPDESKIAILGCNHDFWFYAYWPAKSKLSNYVRRYLNRTDWPGNIEPFSYTINLPYEALLPNRRNYEKTFYD